MQEEFSSVKQDSFSKAEMLKALAIVNIFETGRPFGEFAAVAVLNDGAGISYGLSQFTHRSGSLAAVIERYLELDGAVGRYIFENAMPNMRRKESVVIRAYANDERFKNALRAAAVTREMRIAQLQIAFEKFLQPAIDECRRFGFVMPLSLAVVFDAVTHGSYGKIRDRVRLTPFDVRSDEAVKLTLEKAWITEYVRRRDLWLASIPRLQPTRYRTQFFLNQVMLGEWDLSLPLSVHGFWLRNEHIENLFKFADEFIGGEPAAGPHLDPHKQIFDSKKTQPTSPQALNPTPQAQSSSSVSSVVEIKSAANTESVEEISTRAHAITERLQSAAAAFDRADSFISGAAYRTDRIKSLWTTVIGTVWQMGWAVFGFLIGIPREVWLMVAVVAAVLMLFYLYRQITLGRIREHIEL